MANIILVEGPDNAGKSTYIKELCKRPYTVCLNFPKQTSEGRFTIETRNEVACFETLLKHLNPDYTYVLDRGYLSNIVYGELRAMSKSDKLKINLYREDYIRLCSEHRVETIGLTRNKIDVAFVDDLISLSDGGFNKVIDLFEAEYERFGIVKKQILNHDPKNNLIGVIPNNQ